MSLIWYKKYTSYTHKDIELNEKTDAVAKLAASEGVTVNIKFRAKDALRKIKKILHHKWDENFQ